MFTLLPYAEEIFRVDCRVLTGIRGVKSLSLFPAATKSIVTKWRVFPLSSRLPCNCQRRLGQKRRKSAEACILRQPSASRSQRKIPAHGETRLCISYGSLQTQTILSSPNSDRPDQQAPVAGDKQPWSYWLIGAIGHRIERVWHPIPPANHHQNTDRRRLHSRVHPRRGQGVEESPQWSIHTDGSSNKQAEGGGAALYYYHLKETPLIA